MTRRWIDTASPYRGDPSHGTGSTIVERKGYNVRTRGDTGGTIEHEYECPVHGRFKALVPRADVPDEIGCAARAERHHIVRACGARSLWCPPVVGIGFAAGEVTC